MRIENIPKQKIVYMSSVGPYGMTNEITMSNLKQWAKKNNLLNDYSVILGIPRDNPSLTPSNECRYDTCLIVAEEINDKTIFNGTLSTGRYAVFQVEHTAEAIMKAWSTVFVELNQAGLLVNDQLPIIERYTIAMVNNHQCEICIPIL